jgi:hypothetical protein
MSKLARGHSDGHTALTHVFAKLDRRVARLLLSYPALSCSIKVFAIYVPWQDVVILSSLVFDVAHYLF